MQGDIRVTKKRVQNKNGLLHPENPHGGSYDFEELCKTTPDLTAFLLKNPRGETTIDFSNDQAVLYLNKALLAHYYHVQHWHIPPGYLCPPIPGRADYICYLADLIADHTGPVKVLDIGTGANCIYPIIGSQLFGWHFVACDTDPVAIKAARLLVKSNACLTHRIHLIQQRDPGSVFTHIIQPGDHFDLTMCNPPFYASMEEAQSANQRKRRNLGERYPNRLATRNFGGKQSEIWCPGGEAAFLKRMARESVDFAQQVDWFTSLISRSDHIAPLQTQLESLGAKQIRIVPMQQGQKTSRFIAWRF